MNPSALAPAAELTLALIRLAFGKAVDSRLFERAGDDEWDAVYRFSSRQGVLALAFDGIMSLPETLRPPKSLMLAWGVNARLSAERYRKQRYDLARLARTFADDGLRTLVLKGYGLSLFYPVPEHRPCGDIDIYLFGDYSRGNRLAERSGIPVDPPTTKHTTFRFGDSAVENHRTIVDTGRNRRHRHLETALEELAAEGAVKTSVDYPAGDAADDSDDAAAHVWLPSATLNAVYLPAHAAAHFRGGELALRTLCDWARFLEAEGAGIDRAVAGRLLKRAHLDRFAALMTSFAEEHLGLPAQGFPRPDRRLEERFGQTVFRYRESGPRTDEGVLERIGRVWSGRWRSRDVLRESFIPNLVYTSKLRRLARKRGE